MLSHVTLSTAYVVLSCVCFQERGGANSYKHGNLTLKFKMDNELELIYVVRERW